MTNVCHFRPPNARGQRRPFQRIRTLPVSGRSWRRRRSPARQLQRASHGRRRPLVRARACANARGLRYRHWALTQDDLTSTLINALRTPPYPDYPICFFALHPAQPTWSCSPSTSLAPDDTGGAPDAATRVYWTTFDLKCVRAWAAKSAKDVADAWRVRGESRPGDWRSPGCQARRHALPAGYACFCGAVPT
jgi:hypothetical protein